MPVTGASVQSILQSIIYTLTLSLRYSLEEPDIELATSLLQGNTHFLLSYQCLLLNAGDMHATGSKRACSAGFKWLMALWGKNC